MLSKSGGTGLKGEEGQGGNGSLELPQPYLLFLGDVANPGYAKTAFGLRDWAGDKCLGEFALPQARVSAGLEKLSPAEARAKGARSLVIGVANTGGFIPESWIPALEEGLAAGLDIISGMHARLGELPGLARKAEQLGRRLIDVRAPPKTDQENKSPMTFPPPAILIGRPLGVVKVVFSEISSA